MNWKHGSLFLVFIVGLLSFGIVTAQDATEQATPSGSTIGDVLDDKEATYGQEVSVQGFVDHFENVRTFVFTDDTSLREGQLLVINNTDHEFDLAVKPGQQMQMTGTLYPSYNEGGWAQLAGAETVNGTSPEASGDMITAPAATQMPGMVDLTQLYIPENLRDHTILVLTSLDSVTYFPS